MIRTRQGARWLAVLLGGVAAGCVLALITRARTGGAAPPLAAIVSLLPFLLAVVTGVAKTTTA